MQLTPRRTLLLILAICLLPVVAALLVYRFMPPSRTLNYGELLETRPLPPERLSAFDGRSFSLAELKGKWVMLQVDEGACDEHCRRKLYNMRQVRKAQGKEMDRIERVWLVTDGRLPDGELLRDYEGTRIVQASERLVDALPAAGSRRQHIWLVDPLGNLVLRYPQDPDPKSMIKDFERLLKYSRIG